MRASADENADADADDASVKDACGSGMDGSLRVLLAIESAIGTAIGIDSDGRKNVTHARSPDPSPLENIMEKRPSVRRRRHCSNTERETVRVRASLVVVVAVARAADDARANANDEKEASAMDVASDASDECAMAYKKEEGGSSDRGRVRNHS